MGNDPFEVARKVLREAIDALESIEHLIDSPQFERIVANLSTSDKRIWTTGMGKAGIIANKFSATLASNGIPAAFIHAGEALHGDFGAIKNGDVVIAFSNSGRTDEVSRVAEKAVDVGAFLVLITGNNETDLAQKSNVTLCYGTITESCPLGLTPTTSTTVMSVVSDALAMAVQAKIGLTYEDYYRNHHSGYLGEVAKTKSKK